MNSYHNSPSCLKIKAWFNGQPRVFELKGTKARTIFALVGAGKRGVTALEVSSWAFRLAAYVHALKNGNYNLDICTHDEEHEGGIHARYELLTPVEILEVRY